MIKNVTVKGFKGLDFNQDLHAKTIICGPNGAGKSARSLAITLAILGYIPGTGKTNPDILAAFGKDKLNVGIKINGTALNRQWSKNKKGSVNQAYLVDTRKAGKDAFISALAKAGDPKIFDLSLFMELSDQKKIDYLFNLFPPAGDVSKLDDQITDLSEMLNQKRRDIRDAENFVAKTMANRAQIQLPSGTLAEVTGDIQSLENELSQGRDQLKKAEIELKRKEEAEWLAKEQVEKEKRDRARQEENERAAKAEKEEIEKKLAERERRVEEREKSAELPRHEFKNIDPGPSQKAYHEAANGAADSIKKIMRTIQEVGCEACKNGAAMMVCKSEYRKHI